MTTYVIRSMSTTDYRPGKKVEPFHVYLLRPEHRIGAYWTRSSVDPRIMRFPTIEAAEAEWRRVFTEPRDYSRTDIAPWADEDVAPVWDRLHHRPAFDPKPAKEHALDAAVQMLNDFPGLEIRSALKEAGSREGIPWGDRMGEYVTWAERALGLSRAG